MNEVATIPQTSVIPQAKASALAVMGQRYNVDPAKLLETLKNTVFKNATDSQLMALVVVANEYGLNPFTKQLYAFPDKGGGIVPVVGVDGWLKMMNEHPKFDGVEVEMVEDSATGKPFSCTATIHVKDRKFPTKVTEHLSECARNTDPWNKQPRRMLRHRAIIQAIRVAFGFSAMDPDEAEALTTAKEVNDAKPNFAPSVVTSEPAQTTPEAPRRGRPPKAALPAVTPIEATVTPAAPEPAAPAASATAKVEEPKTVNYVKGIRGMLQIENISEGDLLEFGRVTQGFDDSLSTLEELSMVQPSKLKAIYEDWPNVAKAIKAVMNEK